MPVAALELSARASHCLEAEGVKTVKDLLKKSENELLELRNFGKVTLDEITEKLAEHGLEIGMLAPQD
jgi:DNA-directed RNA polymerase subunit alpha